MHFKVRSNVGMSDSSITEMKISSLRINFTGKLYTAVNVWLTKWSGNRIVEVKTYVDGAVVIELLEENEVWFNSTQHTVHTEFMPGPRGMPPSRIMNSLKDSNSDL